MPTEEFWSPSKRWAGLIAGLYLLVALLVDDGEMFAHTAAFLIIPLFCIWFSDQMGDYIGLLGTRGITRTSPGGVVQVLGWVILLAPLWLGVFVLLYGALTTI